MSHQYDYQDNDIDTYQDHVYESWLEDERVNALQKQFETEDEAIRDMQATEAK